MSQTLQKPDEILGRHLASAEGRERLNQLRLELGERWLDAKTELERQEVLLEMENLNFFEELMECAIAGRDSCLTGKSVKSFGSAPTSP